MRLIAVLKCAVGLLRNKKVDILIFQTGLCQKLVTDSGIIDVANLNISCPFILT
jgi:hypothetical protein